MRFVLSSVSVPEQQHFVKVASVPEGFTLNVLVFEGKAQLV